MPSFSKSVSGDSSEQNTKAIKQDISAHIHHNTWKTVLHREADNLIKSTWAYKLERLPDETSSKFKARFCFRGDLQKKGIDCFEIKYPVVFGL